MMTAPYINGHTIEVESASIEGGQWSMDELTQLKWVTIQQGEPHDPF